MPKQIPNISDEYKKQEKRIRSILNDIESVGLDVDFILPETPKEPTSMHVQSLKRITPKELYSRSSFNQNGIKIDVPEKVARQAVKDYKMSGQKPSLNSIATSSTQPMPTVDGSTTIPAPEIDLSPEELSTETNPDNIDIIDQIIDAIEDLPQYSSLVIPTANGEKRVTVDYEPYKQKTISFFNGLIEQHRSNGTFNSYIKYLHDNSFEIFSILGKMSSQPPSDGEEWLVLWDDLAKALSGRALTQEESMAFTYQEYLE